LEDSRASALADFGAANRKFIAGQEQAREDAEEALIRTLLLIGLSIGACYAVGSYLLISRPLNRSRKMREAEDEFAHTLQLTRSERESYEALAGHLERVVPGCRAVVLNRNSSDNRLETRTSLADDDELVEAVRHATPESCLAIRSGQVYLHHADDPAPLLSCEICGATGASVACAPAVVGGQVIGSVLLRHRGRLTGEQERWLVGTIAAAAPTIANLRNLGVAEYRAATDGMTGLPNSRSGRAALVRLAADARAGGEPLAVLMADLDHFKRVNDQHGHAKGDEVLAAAAQAIKRSLRSNDVAARIGGEEFLILLPNTDCDGALVAAEKVRDAVAGLHVPGLGGITLSIGIAVVPDDVGEAEEALRAADRALYMAKESGRDQVVSFGAADAAEPPGLTLALDALSALGTPADVSR
jgi:diguanylate cyclase